jgi:hypothetical protein
MTSAGSEEDPVAWSLANFLIAAAAVWRWTGSFDTATVVHRGAIGSQVLIERANLRKVSGCEHVISIF